MNGPMNDSIAPRLRAARDRAEKSRAEADRWLRYPQDLDAALEVKAARDGFQQVIELIDQALAELG